MNGLSIAVASDVDGNIRLVLSHVGRVIHQDRATVPNNPSPEDIAYALRKLADKVAALPLMPDELPS